MTISSILQIFGALLILTPFALAQFRLLGQHSWPYLLPNVAGSALSVRSRGSTRSGASYC